ncbi:hypothetical protein [Nocardia sp. CA-135398]|uniref:hypothetical protein n=1 Tax=Nocardia sp. CA-135398 TaxID=3239977 RepID=UPI003D982B2F
MAADVSRHAFGGNCGWRWPRRRAAREVLRRLVEQRVGAGQRSWQLVADLGVRDILILITNSAMRERFVNADQACDW